MSIIIAFPAVTSEDPSPSDLAAIEREWPLIAAELDLLDAEISYINAGPAASALDRQIFDCLVQWAMKYEPADELVAA